MGVPIIFYKYHKFSGISVEGIQDPNFPLQNSYDNKGHTLFKYTDTGNLIEYSYYSAQVFNAIALINHNIYSCRAVGLIPRLNYQIGTLAGSENITSDGLFFKRVTDTTSYGNSLNISNLGTTMPLIGEIWFGKCLVFPYPLASPFVIQENAKYQSNFAEAMHFLNANYRGMIFTCDFVIHFIEASFYESDYLDFLKEARQGKPFVFIPDSDNMSELYWARIKPNYTIPHSRLYAGIYEKIQLSFEMVKF